MTLPIVPRLSHASELPRIMPVMTTAFDPEFGEAWTLAQCSGLLSLPNTALLIVEEAGARGTGQGVTGFALCRSAADEVELLLIAVAPSARRLGVGTALVKATCAWAKAQDSNCIFLEVRNGNPALQLYYRHGFVKVGTRPDYYRGRDGQRYDALTLSLSLKPLK
jgi:[ribosomal protein S18]-alanine N-acetyltransferase